jgi:RNA polymerase sigma factor (sigma-70 family)
MGPRSLEWLKQRGAAFREAVWRKYGDEGLDAMQKCLLTLVAGRQPFNSVAHVARWMWVCVKHRFIGNWRAGIRRRERELERKVPANPADPAVFAEQADLRTAVAECLKRLAEIDQRILEAVYWGGKTYGEFAQDIHRSDGWAKTRARRAQEELRECLESKGVRYEDMLDA